MGEEMLPLIAGVVAAIAGIVVGFWLRSASARRDLTQVQVESAARAGFEALATERERSVARLREELHARTEAERTQSARVKELEAELRNERQNMAEKIDRESGGVE